jgi:rhodanese-related sulfurtransferase
MNRFLKSNSPWLGLLALALIIVVLVFIFRPNPPEYRISAAESLKLMNDPSFAVSVSEAGGKQLIDIRSAELFSRGHAENAVNIPARQILEKESDRFFSQLQKEGKAAIMYGNSELQATSPWLLLQQLGYRNVYRLKGGIVSGDRLSEPDPVSTEIQVLDTAFFRTKPTVASTAVTTGEKKPETVKPVKREARTGGGC